MINCKTDISIEPLQKNCELVLEEHLIEKPLVPAIDIHAHLGKMWLGENYEPQYDIAQAVEAAKGFGLSAMVNLDGDYDDQYDRMLRKTEGFEDFIYTFGSVDLKRIGRSGFEQYARKAILRQASLGMRGIKIWKPLGLSIKDASGQYVRVDDERLNVIWRTAAELKLPVLIHIADPVAFFKPIDARNERQEELRAHPDWSFYGEGRYTFEQLMEMQGNLLANNPETTFIVAHCGSYSENLAQVGKWLDGYSNMHIDIADRLNDLGRQPYTSRAFFERYQDRILLGTDLSPLDTGRYPIYYRFLETMDEYFDYSTASSPPQGDWKIYGIGLSANVLKKVYRENALKILG